MNVVKRIRKSLGKWIIIPIVKKYISQERSITIDDISLKIPIGVFHPTLYFSTKYLFQWLENQDIKEKEVLELGAGSGLLSIKMAKMGANVTASDISKNACDCIVGNAKRNNVSIFTIHSDLFDSFSEKTFDLILINPPYFPRNPQTEAENAWYCGENYEYFEKLFTQLSKYLTPSGKAIMVLSEDCNVLKISSLAISHGLFWQQIDQKKIRFEMNYLFEIK
jgi:release factor glutamine methyltransferase